MVENLNVIIRRGAKGQGLGITGPGLSLHDLFVIAACHEIDYLKTSIASS